jgi:hypothetical protein
MRVIMQESQTSAPSLACDSSHAWEELNVNGHEAPQLLSSGE